ncbi:MAG: glycosyltransferase family 1 protein [Anaerolineae bacterium]|nr:MAG: glycosyltransferase family 1 protein [Anaerolineae bacterium]
MRVLVLIYEFPPVGGGGGRVAEDICRGLVQRGHQVRVLTSHFQGLPRREEIDGIQVERVPVGRKLPFKAYLRDMMGYVLCGLLPALRVVRAWKPDVIHVHFAVPSGALAFVVHLLTGVPYVLTAHLGDVPGGVPEKTGRWFRWVAPFTPPIWRRAARVFGVSEFTRRLAEERYRVKVEVLHNGVDLRALDPGEISLSDAPQVVFAGRFVPQKNPLQVVRALDGVRDLPWHCVMVGDGPLRSAVQAEIQARGLEDRFSLPGWVSPDQVIEYLRESDILFMPSVAEGLPVVGVQALAMGLAVLAGRVGGFVDLVEHGRNGFLLDGSEGQSMGVSFLRQLLTDRQLLLRFRRESRLRAQRFDIENIVDAYEQALRAVARRYGS